MNRKDALPVQFRRAPDDGMGRSNPPHEPQAEIIADARAAAIVTSGPPSLTRLNHQGFQETTNMSAKTDVAAVDVKFNAEALGRIRPSTIIRSDAMRVNPETKPVVVESLQFERGYN